MRLHIAARLLRRSPRAGQVEDDFLRDVLRVLRRQPPERFTELRELVDWIEDYG